MNGLWRCAFSWVKTPANQGCFQYATPGYSVRILGNLVKTVPPLGYAGYTNEDTIAAVNTTRQAGGVNRPPHTMPTAYEYNSLGQMIWQKSPDTEDCKLPIFRTSLNYSYC